MIRRHGPLGGPPAAARTRTLALLAGAAALALSGSAIAAAGVSRQVQKHTVSPDTLCGVTGTSEWEIALTDSQAGNDIGVVAGPVVQTFVAGSGRGVKISYDEGVVRIAPAVYNPDGSSSITVVEAGLNVKAQALGGPLLEQSTGRLTYTYYFDSNGDFVSIAIDSASGPENNVTGAPDCGAIGPYLAGG